MGVWIFKGQSKCGEGFVETETKKKKHHSITGMDGKDK